MFGNNKKEPNKTAAPGGPSAHALNTLTQGAVVEGNLKSDSDIRVDGKIKGKLHCAAKVIIGPTGHIEGEVHCKNAVVEGKFTGKIEVEELLNVRETANIEGDVSVSKLIVQSGAVFNVTCNMGGVKKSDHITSGASKANGEPAKSGKPLGA
jgi:cytoskeletal protein CcmA (bactofilin family)